MSTLSPHSCLSDGGTVLLSGRPCVDETELLGKNSSIRPGSRASKTKTAMWYLLSGQPQYHDAEEEESEDSEEGLEDDEQDEEDMQDMDKMNYSDSPDDGKVNEVDMEGNGQDQGQWMS